MDKKIIDYLSGELSYFETIRFKWRLRRNAEMKKSFREYEMMWDELGYWKENIEVPEIEGVRKVKYLLRLKPAIIIAIIGLSIGFYLGLNSYISASDYMNYAVEVLYEE